MPYPWGKEDKRLVEHYKLIGQIRHENEVYKDGDFKLCYLSPELLVFSRSKGADKLITIVNNADRELSFEFSEKAADLLTDKLDTNHKLQPFGAGIYKVTEDSLLEIIGGNDI